VLTSQQWLILHRVLNATHDLSTTWKCCPHRTVTYTEQKQILLELLDLWVREKIWGSSSSDPVGVRVIRRVEITQRTNRRLRGRGFVHERPIKKRRVWDGTEWPINDIRRIVNTFKPTKLPHAPSNKEQYSVGGGGGQGCLGVHDRVSMATICNSPSSGWMWQIVAVTQYQIIWSDVTYSEEVAVVYFKFLNQHSFEGTDENHGNVGQDNRCPSQDSNLAPPKIVDQPRHEDVWGSEGVSPRILKPRH
jgi:hypothetical protein